MANIQLDEKFGDPGVKVSDSDLKGLSGRELNYLKDRSKLTAEQIRKVGFRPIRNGGVELPGKAQEDAESGEPVDEGYSSWTNADLRQEIDNRNEMRDEEDQLSRSGSKAELVATLEEDDEAEDEG